ncbi:hypothetical protein GCM10023215_59640 [Pseudonocardia yuanmonensis]|uniref:Aminoglycoside phosphotransferase domain-containing protein n=1 Tax=Pseudonocardia yuanmonensis TaxID=1095914 RepID=A0ABP8XKC9_9PSEU
MTAAREGSLGAAEVAARLARHLPVATVTPLGSGLDHDAYEVDGTLIARFGREPDPGARAAAVVREAELLRLLATVCPVPVPPVRLVVPGEGCLVLGRLPGAPLLDRSAADRAACGPEVGAVLGTVLAALHALPPARLNGVVEVDDVEPDVWHDEATETYEAVQGAIPADLRGGVERFLAEPPPPAPERRVLTHNDLGIEHVLVDDVRVTGIIDWSDAAVADPAVDLGRILRDLGRAALDRAVDACGAGDGEPLRTRALFYARCTLLEDLAHGLQPGREQYAAKSLEALPWLF